VLVGVVEFPLLFVLFLLWNKNGSTFCIPLLVVKYKRSFFGDAESLVMFSLIVFDFRTLVVVVGLVLRWLANIVQSHPQTGSSFMPISLEQTAASKENKMLKQP
jgi:hypothetical protein